jgi:hypothetical protein
MSTDLPRAVQRRRRVASRRECSRGRWSRLSAERFLRNRVQARSADAFLQLYPGPTDAMATRSAIDFGGDQFIAYGTWKWMEIDRLRAQSQSSAPLADAYVSTCGLRAVG